MGRWDPRTGTGTVEAVKGQYTDAEGKCHVEALLFEEFGAMSAGVEELLMRVAEVAGRKLTWWQYGYSIATCSTTLNSVQPRRCSQRARTAVLRVSLRWTFVKHACGKLWTLVSTSETQTLINN